jgi:hypothetical protein
MILAEPMQEVVTDCKEEFAELLYAGAASLFPTLSFSPVELLRSRQAAQEVTWIEGTVIVSF